MKVLNDLFDYGLKIYQDEDNFKFSLDTILLAETVKLKKNDIVLDLCTGGAPVPLILSTKYENKIVGIEIQDKVYELAKMNITYNKLNKQIEIINDNLLNIKNYFPGNNFDVITCNPPYFKYIKNSLINESETKAISRHEVTASLSDIINTASFMLKSHGSFYLVHRIDRLQEIANILYEANLFIKELYFIKTNTRKEIYMVIIKSVKNGNYGIKSSVIDVNGLASYKNVF